MNVSDLLMPYVGPAFVILFFGSMVVFAILGRKSAGKYLREIPAFTKLRHAVGLAVEAGTRLHVSLGRGNMISSSSASAVMGITILERVARAASISDRPPVATSGDPVVALLSQDTMRRAYRFIGADTRFDPSSAQLAGVTPFSYAAGTLSVVQDSQVSANVLVGHFGSEVALITDAAERNGVLTIAGTDDVSGQAVLYATAEETLIGEELFAGGAYLGAGSLHTASLRVQDIFRWLLVAAILGGAALKMVGIL